MRLCLVGSMFVLVGSHNPHLYEDVKKCRFYVCVLFSDWQIHTFPRNLYGTRCHVKYVHFPLPVLCLSWGVYVDGQINRILGRVGGSLDMWRGRLLDSGFWQRRDGHIDYRPASVQKKRGERHRDERQTDGQRTSFNDRRKNPWDKTDSI